MNYTSSTLQDTMENKDNALIVLDHEEPSINNESNQPLSQVVSKNENSDENLLREEQNVQSHQKNHNISIEQYSILKNFDRNDNKATSIENRLNEKSKDTHENLNLLKLESISNSVTKHRRKVKKTTINELFYFMEPLAQQKRNKKYVDNKSFLKKNKQSNCTLQNEKNVQFETVGILTIDEIQENPSVIPCQIEMSDTQLEILEMNNEEKMLFEVQYFSLMKHAEKMLNNLDYSQVCIKNMTSEGILIYKKQYSSLFNSAKKMYTQMKNERLNK